MRATDAPPTLAEELRRRRIALGWSLEQVAAQAQVSVGMLSLIETGKRRPSLRSWGRIRQTLGITEPLPEEAWRLQPREISDELVATLGACLAAVRIATLAELGKATGVPISEVRLALRRLGEQLEAAGMEVLDDGSHVQSAPERRFHGAVAHLVRPEQVRRLTQGAGRGAGHRDLGRNDHPAPDRGGQRGGAVVDRAGETGLAASRQLGDAGPAALPRPALCGAGRSWDGTAARLPADAAIAPAAGRGNARGGADQAAGTGRLPVADGASP